MFERFTNRARRVVVLAQEEARLLSHNYIGTEHLLLGLLHENEGMAAHVLEEMGVSLDAVRGEVMTIVGTGESSPSGHIPFTPRAKKVLELSLREALQLGTDYIGTEHLLLGLIREGEGVAAQILVRLGQDLGTVRRAVITLYERHSQDAGAGEHERRDVPGDRPVAMPAEPASGSGPRLPMPGFLQSRRTGRPGSASVSREYGPGLVHPLGRLNDPVAPRLAETELLAAVLARREHNNALLVGPVGSGKSALVRGLAQEIAAGRGPASLGDAEVLQLDPPALRIGVERLARRGSSPIMLVEDLDLLLGADESSGNRLVLGIASFAEAAEPLIVTATPQAREKLAALFPTLVARFEPVELPEADAALALKVLRLLRPTLQEFHNVAIEDAALTAAVELAPQMVGGRALPGGAVDLLDAAAARLTPRRGRGSGETPVLREQDLRRAS